MAHGVGAAGVVVPLCAGVGAVAAPHARRKQWALLDHSKDLLIPLARRLLMLGGCGGGRSFLIVIFRSGILQLVILLALGQQPPPDRVCEGAWPQPGRRSQFVLCGCGRAAWPRQQQVLRRRERRSLFVSGIQRGVNVVVPPRHVEVERAVDAAAAVGALKTFPQLVEISMMRWIIVLYQGVLLSES